MKRKIIPSEIKTQILNNIKNNGVSVRKTALEYQISEQTIHSWLKKEENMWGMSRSNMVEIRRLQKDKDDLLIIIGAMHAELDKLKKKK